MWKNKRRHKAQNTLTTASNDEQTKQHNLLYKMDKELSSNKLTYQLCYIRQNVNFVNGRGIALPVTLEGRYAYSLM
jgi:hypothetical protein